MSYWTLRRRAKASVSRQTVNLMEVEEEKSGAYWETNYHSQDGPHQNLEIVEAEADTRNSECEASAYSRGA